jgi:hypothetical protein
MTPGLPLSPGPFPRARRKGRSTPIKSLSVYGMYAQHTRDYREGQTR